MINTIKATINLTNVCLDEVDLGNGVIYRGDDLATTLEIKAPINSNAYVLLACITPNGRNLGPFNADNTTSSSTATTYEFLLTKENGYNFAVGRTELIVYYCVVNTNSSISKKAIGSICVDVKKGVSVDDEATFIIGDTTDADAVLTDLNTKMDNLINQVASYSTQLSNKLDKVSGNVTLSNSGVLFTSRVESGTDYTVQSQGRNGISSAVDSSSANNNENSTSQTTTRTITDKTSSKSTEQKQTANFVTLKATDGTNTNVLAIAPQSININGVDVVVEDDLTAEATARQGADNTLQTNIDNEALARGNADTILQANIDASGHKIEVLKDLSTYQYTFRLLDANDNVLSSQLIDLPIESMIINVSYDATNKDLIITLQSGTTLTVPLDDIISGLASQDWVNTQLQNYVQKENGKGLSTNDYTNEEKVKLDNAYGPAYVGKDTSTNILAKSSNSGIWVGTDTGHWYYWNGTQYVDGGVYQATEIEDGSITPEKTNFVIRSNYFDKNNAQKDKWCGGGTGGNIITGLVDGNGYILSQIIEVTEGDVIYIGGHFGTSGRLITATADGTINYNASTQSGYTIPSNIKYIRVAFSYANDQSIYQETLNQVIIRINMALPTDYLTTSYNFNDLFIPELILNDNSVGNNNIKNSSISKDKLDTDLSNLILEVEKTYYVNPHPEYSHTTYDGATAIINKIKNNGKPIINVQHRARYRNGIGKAYCGLVDGSKTFSNNETLDSVKSKCTAISNVDITTAESTAYTFNFTFNNILFDTEYIYVVIWTETTTNNIYFTSANINSLDNIVDIATNVVSMVKYGTGNFINVTSSDDAKRYMFFTIEYKDLSLNASSQWNGKKCATLGTSLTYNGGWSDVVKERLGFSKMYNRGKGGSTLANFTGYGLTDYVSYIDTYDDTSLYNESPDSVFYNENNPIEGATHTVHSNCSWYSNQARIDLIPADVDLVLVDLCTNDFYRSFDKDYITEEEFTRNTTIKSAWGESQSQQTYDDKYYQDAFMLMVKRIQTRCPNAKIVVWGMLYNATVQTSNGSMEYYINLIELTKKMCQMTGVYFIDVMAEMGVNVFNMYDVIQDGVHPYTPNYTNEKGKYGVANCIINHLKNINPIEG